MSHHQPRTFGRRLKFWALISFGLTVGCVPPGKPDPAQRPEMPDQILGFDKLFAVNCAGCHGSDGTLGPAPPLNDPLFIEIVPDDLLLATIRNGRPGTPMPPFAVSRGGALTDEQIVALAQGMKDRWRSRDKVGQGVPPYLQEMKVSHPIADEQRRSAEAIFTKACADCHGEQGRGVGDDGENAINVPAFLALISDQAIRRTILCGRQDLGMPNFAESDGRADDFQPLDTKEIDLLVALISHWRAVGDNLVLTPP